MTIKDAIFVLNCVEAHNGICNEAKEMAIKSLEAWENCMIEIDKQTEIHADGEFYIKNIDVKRIIDKHLAEVTK